jgi:hypothetical protein
MEHGMVFEKNTYRLFMGLPGGVSKVIGQKVDKKYIRNQLY